VEHNKKIHIIDTGTLAGAQRYLVQKAVKLRKSGFSIEKVIEELYKCIETSVSFVIPEDFEFLKRSGRLTPLTAKIGGLIKIVPVMTQTADKRRIETFCIKRSRKKAVEAIIEHLRAMGVGREHLITVGHGGALEKAKEVLGQIKEQFGDTAMEILPLSPALITHGGPGCITIQAIHK
jgi:DegV family protein with EDD domain